MTYKRKNGLLTADMNGQAVMMDIETGKYYNLGDTGGRIWELLENETTAQSICEALLQEYEVAPDECLRDVQRFLNELTQRGLAITA